MPLILPTIQCTCTCTFVQIMLIFMSTILFLSFLSPQSPSGVVMKALGLLINLTQDGEETESLMVDHGAALLGILVSLLQDSSNEEMSDQVVCLLVNLSGCSVEKVKDILAGCDDLMRAAARILVGLFRRYYTLGVCCTRNYWCLNYCTLSLSPPLPPSLAPSLPCSLSSRFMHNSHNLQQTSKHTGILMGVCQLVKNLADTSVPGWG